MSAYQSAKKLAVPAATPIAIAASSFLGGKHASAQTTTKLSSQTSQCMNSMLTRSLHTRMRSIINNTNSCDAMKNSPLYYQQRRMFASAPPLASPNKAAAAAAKPTTLSIPSNSNRGFLPWYEHHLKQRPVSTKAVTGSILWGIGDVVAQIVPKVFFDDESDDKTSSSNESKASSSSISVLDTYNFERTGRAMFFGFAIHAPLSHVHFNFLEWMTVKGGFTGLSIPVFKTIMEQFVYWSWISNSLYHGSMGAMQGMTFEQIYERIANVLWDTQKAQWVFWIPVQLVNFRFVPVRHQLNVVLLTSIVWTALLSAWYPPEEDETDKKIDGEKQ